MRQARTDGKGSGLLRLGARNLFFLLALLICGTVAVIGIVYPEKLANACFAFTDVMLGAIGWFFMAAVTGFIAVCFYLAFSKYGSIRLGGPDERPEFSTASWMAMLFAAGMGVGLLFWGAAEPVFHYSAPPVGVAGTPTAARDAIALTAFHWGIHAWAIYGVTALVLAYFGFRRKAPYMPGAPILHTFRGKWVKSAAWLADLIGILAVVFGVAGSMAMGIMQIQAGTHVLVGLPLDSVLVAMIILALMCVAYNLSAATSINKGIKWLSNINMAVAVVLMLFVLLAGPTGVLLKGCVTALGDYANSLVGITLRLFPFRNLDAWTRDWTLNYFIFWVAWSPFVGVFIARISRGRTIREFVLGVILAPTIFSVFWFVVFGGTAIHEELVGAGGIAELVKEDVNIALFSLFDRLPLSDILCVTAIFLVFIFLVTSADSATFVLGMLTSRGSLNPSARRKITWGVFLAVLTAALVLTDNVFALRGIVITGAFPFIIIMLLQIAALLKSVKKELPRKPAPPAAPPREDGHG